MHLSFKEFHAETTSFEKELIAEGMVADAAGAVAKSLGALINAFVSKFKRKPTPKELFDMRKALRDKQTQLAKQGGSSSTIKPSGTTSAAAQGAAAERDWVANLLAQQEADGKKS